MPFSFRSQIPSDHVTMALLTSDGMSTVELALYGVILVHVLALVRLPLLPLYLVNYLRVSVGINHDLAAGLLGVGGCRGAAGGECGPGAQEGVVERGKTELVFVCGRLRVFCGLDNVLIKCAVLFLGLDDAWHDDWVGRCSGVATGMNTGETNKSKLNWLFRVYIVGQGSL